MPLRFTNTLTGQKEDFKPLKEGQVSLYVCGVTVYDHCHIGHARGAVVFDVLRRYLESDRYKFKVTHVRNITDVDDKIIDRARLESSGDLKNAALAVARRYEESFQKDFSELGLLPPTNEPRATEYIPKMVRFIENLMKAGYAYPGSDGVYFSVKKFEEKFGYGHLSHQKLEQMLEGVRIAPGEGKKEPLDFALWKKAKPEEPSWPSPWGEGRPGWHIECSTMSTDLLGDAFDIHGGGQDLIFPHHENERIQALGAGKKFARYWLHNGLLTVNGQKMSKSVGNIVTIGDALKRHPNPDVLRLFFLSAHYRSPVDFTWERLDEAASAYNRFQSFLTKALLFLEKSESKEEQETEAMESAEEKFYAAMDDDLNTPEALSALYELVNQGIPLFGSPYSQPGLILGPEEGFPDETVSDETAIKEVSSYMPRLRYVVKTISELGNILGCSFPANNDTDPHAQKLAQKRDEARAKREYKTADDIRRQLVDMGYLVEDTDRGTVVRKRV